MSADVLISQHTDTASIGLRLQAAREKLGLSVDDLSHAIKVQATAIRQIEQGEFGKLGPAVFAKGFLRSYAKFVHMDANWLDTELGHVDLSPEPTLLPSQGERNERDSMIERMMPAASYLVGTAILASAIFLVTRFDRIVSPAKSVSSPSVSTSVEALTPARVSAEKVVEARTLATFENQSESQPLGAPSVLDAANAQAPGVLIAHPGGENDVLAAGMAAIPALAADQQAFELAVTGLSWVEITDSTGRRLEFNNLSGGVRKSYSGVAPFSLKIGNSPSASLIVGGKSLDLAPFSAANIAKVRLVERNGVLEALALEPRAQ